MAISLPTTLTNRIPIPPLTKGGVEAYLEIWSYGFTKLHDHIQITHNQYACPLAEAEVIFAGLGENSDPYFCKFHTLPSWQGCGLGRLVFASAIYSVSLRNKRTMWWHAVTNPSGMRLYAEFGARKPLRTTNDYFHDNTVQEVSVTAKNATIYQHYLNQVRSK